MKVKFLRDVGEDKKGSTKEVDDQKGSYWIQMGLVEDVSGQTKKVSKAAPVKKSAAKKGGKK